MLNVGQYAITWGRFTEAAVRLQRAADVATAIEFHRLLAATDVAGALLDWHRGHWSGLRERLSAVVDADDVRALTRTEARLIRGLLDLAEGNRGAAEDDLRAVLDHAARLGFAEPGTTLAAAALGRLHLADGEAVRALQVTQPMLEMIERKDVWLWAGDIAPVHCSALVAVGDVDGAERVARCFAAGLGELDAPGPRAAVTTCHALLAEARGDRRGAGVLFGDAAAAWATLPRPYDEQLALERRGVNLVHEDRGAGVKVLTSVESRLRELGARRDADRVAHTLRSLGVDVPRAWKRGPRGYGNRLSPREREVLALVAQGMTNREAARVLFLSPKTVGRHLGTAMRKLGVSSRTAAAMAAAETGLIPAGSRAQDPRR
jgi:DNA-binding CsgD family transcriptional regulator